MHEACINHAIIERFMDYVSSVTFHCDRWIWIVSGCVRIFGNSAIDRSVFFSGWEHSFDYARCYLHRWWCAGSRVLPQRDDFGAVVVFGLVLLVLPNWRLFLADVNLQPIRTTTRMTKKLRIIEMYEKNENRREIANSNTNGSVGYFWCFGRPGHNCLFITLIYCSLWAALMCV